jgi:hypothetical protein
VDARSELNRPDVALPARVHIILARAADTAVIVRRGPSKQVCVLGWDCPVQRIADTDGLSEKHEMPCARSFVGGASAPTLFVTPPRDLRFNPMTWASIEAPY